MASHLIIEIKATCTNLDMLRIKLLEAGADFKGKDFQTDTYFNCPNGRLKLRQGNIENSLIFYQRENSAAPKGSKVNMMPMPNGAEIHSLLTAALGILVAVKKAREIYFIDNVKFHLDEVSGLGTFIEIEAIDFLGTIGAEQLQFQCNTYMQLLHILPEHLLTHSYSDMLMQQKNNDIN